MPGATQCWLPRVRLALYAERVALALRNFAHPSSTMSDAAVLIAELRDLLAEVATMGDPATGMLSPGERAQLRARLDALWARRAEFPLDDLGLALFERARRIVDGALDS